MPSWFTFVPTGQKHDQSIYKVIKREIFSIASIWTLVSLIKTQVVLKTFISNAAMNFPFLKTFIVILSLVGLVQAEMEDFDASTDISLVCDRTGNPCLEDLADPRFTIVSLMIESALELREYEIENGLSTPIDADTEWKYSKDGWRKDSSFSKSKKHKKSGKKPGFRGLAKEGSQRGSEEIEEFDPEHAYHRELGPKVCKTACIRNPQLYVCSFMCGSRRKRRLAQSDEENICTEEIHLRTFLEEFPTRSIEECVANVACTLSMPCNA